MEQKQSKNRSDTKEAQMSDNEQIGGAQKKMVTLD